jgi:hypothetical protein
MRKRPNCNAPKVGETERNGEATDVTRCRLCILRYSNFPVISLVVKCFVIFSYIFVLLKPGLKISPVHSHKLIFFQIEGSSI